MIKVVHVLCSLVSTGYYTVGAKEREHACFVLCTQHCKYLSKIVCSEMNHSSENVYLLFEQISCAMKKANYTIPFVVKHTGTQRCIAMLKRKGVSVHIKKGYQPVTGALEGTFRHQKTLPLTLAKSLSAKRFALCSGNSRVKNSYLRSISKLHFLHIQQIFCKEQCTVKVSLPVLPRGFIQ